MSSGLYESLLQEIAAVLDIFDRRNPAETSTDMRRNLVQAVRVSRTSSRFPSDHFLCRSTDPEGRSKHTADKQVSGRPKSRQGDGPFTTRR